MVFAGAEASASRQQRVHLFCARSSQEIDCGLFELPRIARVTTNPGGLPSSTAFRILSANSDADISGGRPGQFLGPAGAQYR